MYIENNQESRETEPYFETTKSPTKMVQIPPQDFESPILEHRNTPAEE